MRGSRLREPLGLVYSADLVSADVAEQRVAAPTQVVAPQRVATPTRVVAADVAVVAARTAMQARPNKPSRLGGAKQKLRGIFTKTSEAKQLFDTLPPRYEPLPEPPTYSPHIEEDDHEKVALGA